MADGDVFGVETLLLVRDQATAQLRRFSETLRAIQAQTQELAASLRTMLAGFDDLVVAQREALALTARESEVRAGISEQISRQSEVLVASRSRSLELARAELATQRETLAASRAAVAGGDGGSGVFGGSGDGAVGMAKRALKDAALAGGALAVDAIYEAGKLQTNMLGIKNSTGASAAQLRSLQQAIFKSADETGTSAVEMSKEYVTAARASGGVFRKKDGSFDMAGFQDIASDVAKAAQVQHITRGTDLADAVRTQMETVHLFRNFRGAQLKHILDLDTRLSEVMPNSMKEAEKQFTYFEPTFKAMGISDNDSFATLAAFSRAGYGTGKGGTNTQDLVQAALPALEMTRHAQTGKKALLEKYGFLDSSGTSPFFNNNKADLTGFIQHLEQLHTKYGRDDLIVGFKSIFGQQGSRMANVFSDPKILDQLVGIKQILQDPKLSLDEQFKGYTQTFDFQAGRAWHDFQSLMTEVGGTELKGFTAGLFDLGGAFHNAQAWLHQHRDLEMRVQRDIVNGVAGVEQYIVSHRSDWVQFRNDMAYAYNEAEQLGPTIRQLADFLGALYQTVRDIGGAMTWVNNIPNILGASQRTNFADPSSSGEYVPAFPQATPLSTVRATPYHAAGAAPLPWNVLDRAPVVHQLSVGEIHVHDIKDPGTFAKALRGHLTAQTGSRGAGTVFPSPLSGVLGGAGTHGL